MIGPLLAPSFFLYGLPREKFGKASKKLIQSALCAFECYLKKKGIPFPFVVTSDEAIEVLVYLELCIPLKGGTYQITALLSDSRPNDAWVKESTLDVYRCQRYECDRSVDIISPSSFVILQSRCSRLDIVSHKVRLDGINLVKIVDRHEIHCLIQMGIKRERHCIDVILRWSSEAESEAVAKEFLDELKSMIATARDERSPDVILNWFYLDSSHLEELNENPAVYSLSDVDEKVRGDSLDSKIFSVRPEKDSVCRIRDLVIFPAGIRCASGTVPCCQKAFLYSSCPF